MKRKGRGLWKGRGGGWPRGSGFRSYTMYTDLTQAGGLSTLAKSDRCSRKLDKDSVCGTTVRTRTRKLLRELATGTSETV